MMKKRNEAWNTFDHFLNRIYNMGYHKLGVLLILGLFSIGARCASQQVITAAQIIENRDSSKTFIAPRVISIRDGQAFHLGIKRGAPGTCHLFGMDDYLSDYVVWSRDLMETVKVDSDGSRSDETMGFYIQSITCVTGKAHNPKITANKISKNADGSVTVSTPMVHYGPKKFPIHSGHAGACHSLGYSTSVTSSIIWSEELAEGAYLSQDGKIYDKVVGTYATVFKCSNNPEINQ